MNREVKYNSLKTEQENLEKLQEEVKIKFFGLFFKNFFMKNLAVWAPDLP
jgi:hypothetical protein